MATRLYLPTDLEADGSTKICWFDPSDLATITQSGGLVSTIASKGKFSVTASAPGNKPGYAANDRNGKPTIKQMGNSSYLSFDPTPFMGTTSLTVAISAYLDNVNFFVGSDYWCRLFSFGDYYSNRSIQILRRGDYQAATEIQANSGTLDWMGKDRFMVDVVANSAGTVFVDGTQQGSATYGGAFAGNIGWIFRGIEYNDDWPGSFQQIVIVNRALTTAERQKLEGWESWYTGKNGSNLAVGHPFKAAAPTITTGGVILPRRRRLILLSA